MINSNSPLDPSNPLMRMKKRSPSLSGLQVISCATSGISPATHASSSQVLPENMDTCGVYVALVNVTETSSGEVEVYWYHTPGLARVDASFVTVIASFTRCCNPLG